MPSVPDTGGVEMQQKNADSIVSFDDPERKRSVDKRSTELIIVQENLPGKGGATEEDPEDHSSGGHDHTKPEDWKPIEFKGFRLHKYYVERPCSCYAGLCAAFWFWWVIMIICIMAIGEDFLLFTNEFPFWIQSHRTQQGQDGVFMMKKDATYSPGEEGGNVTTRSEFESMAQVIYIANDGQDMLSPSILQRIEDFEGKLLAEEKWTDEMCWKQRDGSCMRKSSATLFWADDAVNTQQWFPTSYDRYPTFGNTLKYSESYQVNNEMPEMNFDQTSVSEFWVNYGHQEFGSALPVFSYFSDGKCREQTTKCREVSVGRVIADPSDPTNETLWFRTQGQAEGQTGPTCIDQNQDIEDSYDLRETDPVFADWGNFRNCPELVDWMAARNLGCDDSFAVLSDTFPDATPREMCCAECFRRWYPTGDYDILTPGATDVQTITIDEAVCGLGLTEDTTNDNLLLQVCIDTNKGAFTTEAEFSVEGTIVDISSDVVAAVESLLVSADIHFNEISTSTAVAAPTYDVIVEYPWRTESVNGQDFFQQKSFQDMLANELTSQGVTAVSSVSVSRVNTPGKEDVYQKSVSFNPLWDVTDGAFGASSDMSIAKKATALRTVLPMGFPLDGYSSSSDDRDAQVIKLGDFCYEAWQTHLDEGIGDDVQIFWNCEGMQNLYVMDKLMLDSALLLGTVLFVTAFMIFVSGSYFLALNGMGMLFLNFGPTIVIYSGIFGINFFGILQVMSLFLIMSIGADDIFVMLDTWGQTNVKYWKEHDAEERLSFTLRNSGKVMLTTSLSTIASFAANATSVFPAIRTFGIFCAVLIFVNYMAVCIFYPSVMMVHELFFQDENSPCGTGCGSSLDFCCVFCNCACKNCFKGGCCAGGEGLRERNLNKADVPRGDEKRAIDEWFGGAYYEFLHKVRMLVIFAGLVIAVLFTAYAANITTDPEPPNIYPDANNYYVWGKEFKQSFTRHTSDLNVVAWITFGLSSPGINRPKGHKDTDVVYLGDPTYDVRFNPFGEEQMEYLCAMCDDIESGVRYNDRDGRKVDETIEGGQYAVQCPFTEFRNWVWDQDPSSTYNLDGSAINTESKSAADMDLVTCINREIAASRLVDTHVAGEWPIEGFWQNWKRWDDWMQDEMPVDNPSYERGKSNYAYFNEQLWYQKDSGWTPQIGGGPDCDANIVGTPKVMQIFVRLAVTNSYDYSDGITLYENWESWLEKWTAGTVGGAGTYIPSTTHCDGLSPINVCEITHGCVWENSICSAAPIPMPGPAPKGVSSVYVTDVGMFSYFYLQEQLISECVLGIVLALFAAFLILNWATRNYIIATVSTCVISIIVILVIGFTVMCGWKLGILESIIYVMVVGMAVDYVVHLGEAYLEAAAVHHDRHSRAREMLEVRGFSIVSGAVSTLGGIVVLFFAFIIFFYKFAVVMFFLIAMSLWYSLVFFAAVMDSFGPSGDFGEWQHVLTDLQHVWNGDLTTLQCCQNCFIPHESEHFERHETNRSEFKLEDDASGKFTE